MKIRVIICGVYLTMNLDQVDDIFMNPLQRDAVKIVIAEIQKDSLAKHSQQYGLTKNVNGIYVQVDFYPHG